MPDLRDIARGRMQAFDTARLLLRPLSQDDEALYCDLYTDPDTMRYIDKPMSGERAERCFREAVSWSKDAAGDPQFLAMIEKSTQRAIGICGVLPPDASARRVEIGMMLLSGARARGYATEALTALVTATFSAFPIDSVWVQYSSEHVAAERLVISVGFERCANGGIGSERDGKSVWSIDRSSWCSRAKTNNRGEDDVERDRLSRNDGTGCVTA